jgi:transcriptional regulator with XRE-family HTH domain
MRERDTNKEVEAICNQFGRNVRALRLRKEWTQQQLADTLGWHRITITRIESGIHQPLFAEACLMADLLGVKVGELRYQIKGLKKWMQD